MHSQCQTGLDGPKVIANPTLAGKFEFFAVSKKKSDVVSCQQSDLVLASEGC